MKNFNDYLTGIAEIGFVEEALPSLVYAGGLPTGHQDEIVLFETGEQGQILTLAENKTEILVFAKYPIRVGTRIVRTNTYLEIPIGKEMIGKILDPFGIPIDKSLTYKKPSETRTVDMEAPGIKARKKISKSLETGVIIVDMLIPLGKGQRELVLGDRKTGKTNFILQTILHQAQLGTLCIYVAIGKKKSDIKKAEEFFLKYKIMDKLIMLVSTSEDSTSSIYITPYSSMTVAEYFKDQGQDVLLVLDDLTTHAKFYREINLLGNKFPGRNAYPADIFYTHAKLLERAGNFTSNKSLADGTQSETSITCIPVVETVQGDITGYIQTNIMSMTDGHIYFDNELFTKGRRPAVNPFLSVTRVGRQTQTDLERTITRELISFLTLREKIENFAHFGAEVNASIKEVLITGERVIAFFEQSSERVIKGNIQIFIFTMVWFGIWRNASIADMNKQIDQIIVSYDTNPKFQQIVEEFLTKSDSLNTLLGMIRDNLLMITTMINLKLPPNPMTEALLTRQASPTPPATGLNAATAQLKTEDKKQK